MPITITGGKYAVASVSSVGTTTVTVSTTPFVSGDFSVPRRVDLYNSTGSTFKGTAFVRRFISTSQLELETEFFDPKTGATVSQVVGDTLFVSKNWADVATAGIAIANNVVTVSDTIVFGTASDIDSLCFHDEDQLVQNTVTTNNAKLYDVAGGFITFGHLQSWANKQWYGGCHFVTNNTNSCNSFVAISTAARMCMFGGSHRGQGSNPLYIGTGNVAGVSTYGTDWAYFWALDVKFDSTDVMSVSGGGNWTTGANHVLETNSYVGTGTNLILVRWGNGSVIGGQFKFPRFTSSPLSVFGSDSAGTYAIGAPAGDRSVVLDIGSANALWRAFGTPTQTVNATNLITSSYEVITSGTTTKNVYFLENYTNLQDATKAAIIRDSDWTTDDTDTSSGSASTLGMQVFYGGSTATTSAIPTYRGPWTYRIRKYGYDEQEGAIAESDYSLGTAGTAKNVSFGGRIDQQVRSSLTDSEATALAYAGITVTDHGASPVTWNGKAYSITITVDRTTYPSRTAAQVFAHVKAKIASLATWGGKAGILWHVLMEESGSSYVTQRGKSGGAGASLKGVRVITDTGAAMPGVTAMVADDGTTYNPPELVFQSVELSGLVTGSRVQLYDTTSSTEVLNDIASGSTLTWTDTTEASASRAMRVRVSYVSGASAKEFIEASIGTCGITDGTQTISYLIAQSDDVVYNANAIDGSTVTGITFTDAATDIVNIDISAGSVSWAQIYAAFVYWISTSAGIADDIAYISAVDQANYRLTSMQVKNTSSPSVPLKITGGYGVDAATLDPIDLVDTTGGTLFMAPPHVVNNIVTVGGVNVITGDIADIPAAPSAAAIATQVLASAQSAPIYADIRKVNDLTVNGSGTEIDPWGP